MTKEEYLKATSNFFDAFFKVGDAKNKSGYLDYAYYSVPVTMDPPIWIQSRNSENPYYDLLYIKGGSDPKWKTIRRAYASTKGCVTSLLKAYLDYCEEEEKNNVAF